MSKPWAIVVGDEDTSLPFEGLRRGLEKPSGSFEMATRS